MILCGIQQWKFKKHKKKIISTILILSLISFLDDFTKYDSIIDIIISVVSVIVIPLIINYRKWFYIGLIFILSNVFLAISFWLEGFNNGREMGATFENYNEDEFYTTYLMIVSDYKKGISDPQIAILQSQEWLEDDDSKLKGSDKLCAYYYEVIKAGEED